MSFLSVAPYLSLEADAEGGVLRISAGSREDWFADSLAADLAATRGLESPWLPRLESERLAAEFALSVSGVTLSALWRVLSVDEQAFVTVSLLRTLLRAGPVSMFPRSGVLCGTDGVLSLVPPFKRLVDGAAKTWDDFQFDEYCIGGMSREPTHCLAITLQRLLVRMPLHELFALRTITPALPSATVRWLEPLDELVSAANDELWNKRPAAAGSAERWASTLVVLEDQYQQSSPVLADLVQRAWPDVGPEARWA